MTYKATVFIPTFNAEPYLSDILKAVFTQEVPYVYEVLIIDSGSTDKTLDIIAKFPKVRLHQIPNNEFGHGKTRQLAAEMAKGEFVVYLSHDAVPAHKAWLYEMLKPFELSQDIVGVMGKQVPRLNCPPMLKYEINSVFRQFGPDFGTTVFYKDDFIKDRATYDAVRFYSDVNSAARKSVLLGKIPYRDVAYAEDQMFGEDVLEAGQQKAYAPRGLVVHSNDIELKDYHKRIFDETFGLRKNGAKVLKQSSKKLIKGILRDSVRICIDRQYTLKRKAYWLFANPLYQIQRHRGINSAVKTDLNDSSVSKKSLEHKQKKQS